MGSSCIFCKVFELELEILHESEHFFSIFDRFPVSPGHALVIPKRHIVSILDLSDAEWMDMGCSIRGTIEVIENAHLERVYLSFMEKPISERSKGFCQAMLNSPYTGRRPDGYNIGVNEGKAAGKTVDHLHIHIIPRYAGDVEDPVGGVRHVISGFAKYR